jgi:limonene-1,2-epoxide hydrolase
MCEVVGRLALVGAVLAVAAVGSAEASAAAKPAAVVRAWSSALNKNDNEHAARLFAKNARVVQPGVDVRLNTHALAVAFNDSLPCAGKVVAITVRGRAAVATFLLAERPKHRCDAPGNKAAALFILDKQGRIAVWQQVAVPVPKKPTA